MACLGMLCRVTALQSRHGFVGLGAVRRVKAVEVCLGQFSSGVVRFGRFGKFK